jgi:hypothetical protein
MAKEDELLAHQARTQPQSEGARPQPWHVNQLNPQEPPKKPKTPPEDKLAWWLKFSQDLLDQVKLTSEEMLVLAKAGSTSLEVEAEMARILAAEKEKPWYKRFKYTEEERIAHIYYQRRYARRMQRKREEAGK